MSRLIASAEIRTQSKEKEKGMLTLENLEFGLEIELTGVPRKAAIEILKGVMQEHECLEIALDNKIKLRDGRVWQIVNDTSIGSTLSVKWLENVTTNGVITYSDIQRMSQLVSNCTIEVVSPICTMRDWPVIQALISEFREQGGVTNDTCGIHLHISRRQLSDQVFLKLVNQVARYEGHIYKMFNIHSTRKIHYASQMPDALNHVASQFKGVQTVHELALLKDNWRLPTARSITRETRYRGLNLYNIYTRSGKSTVEFRYFNSVLHAGKIRSYIYFIFGLILRAQNGRIYSPSMHVEYITEGKFHKLLNYWHIYDEAVREHLTKGFFGSDYYHYGVKTKKRVHRPNDITIERYA